MILFFGLKSVFHPSKFVAQNKEEEFLKSSKFTVIILTSFLFYVIIFLNDNVHKIESELSAHL